MAMVMGSFFSMAFPGYFRPVLPACLALVLPFCGEMPSQADGPGPSATTDVGFEAAITGSYEGEVSGAGVLVLLPKAGFENQGYFFLADGRGIRPHGVTFILPRGLVPGKHVLKSPSPFDIGTVPSVRVDRDMGDAVRSADRNTRGFVELVAFPNDEGTLRGSEVTGSFEFETEDSTGETIMVKGKFSFKAG